MFIELHKINLDFIAQKQEFSFGITDTSLRIRLFLRLKGILDSSRINLDSKRGFCSQIVN